ncbi:MAG: PAC2 family protein [Dehalococcoidales bacterium]|nr:PAC2 family protein [Dehalococcoidales bacterium]
MNNLVKIYARPKLKDPILLAAWPGIGNVSMILTSYMLDKLEFRDLAELDAASFFEPIGVLAREHTIEAPSFPESHFYYWKNKKGDHDIIVFIGDDQPSTKVYDLAGCVLDYVRKLGVKRVYTCAAALTKIHFTEQPKTWAVATNKDVVEELKTAGLLQKGTLQIAGLNGLLLGVAKEKGMDGVCLLGEVPMQTSRMENPVAALAILKVFAKLMSMPIDTAELAENAEDIIEQVKQANAIAMGEYLEHFTQPIWEQDSEDGEDEEEPPDGNELQN